MKIPESIRLNGVEYAIEFGTNLNDGVHVASGLFMAPESKIVIDKNMTSYQQQCITFLHELCHAILFEYHVDLDDENAVPKNEEILAEIFARGMYQFLQDNARKLFDICEPKEEYDEQDADGK